LKNTVVPAQAGTHFDLRYEITSRESKWIPAFAGMTKLGTPGVIAG